MPRHGTIDSYGRPGSNCTSGADTYSHPNDGPHHHLDLETPSHPVVLLFILPMPLRSSDQCFQSTATVLIIAIIGTTRQYPAKTRRSDESTSRERFTRRWFGQDEREQSFAFVDPPLLLWMLMLMMARRGSGRGTGGRDVDRRIRYRMRWHEIRAGRPLRRSRRREPMTASANGQIARN
jgi:hypothetical protein